MPSAPLQQDAIDGEWKPSAADLRSLGRTGKAFLATWLRVHVLNAKEGVIALAAARCRDDADRWRKRSRTKTPQAARFARLALEAEKHFAFLLGQLRVTS